MQKVKIGLCLDWQLEGSFSTRPHYAVREHYFNAIWAMGGLPIGLPLIADAMDEYLNNIDGLVIPGGDYPSPSRWYGDGFGIPDEHPRTQINEKLILTAIAKNLPFLAICAGMQELVAATGGLLHWRVKDSLVGALEHREIPLEQLAHALELKPDSMLANLAGQNSVEVNSHHNEGIKTLGPSLVATATAPDGLIEAVEVPGHPFGIGVQWHPEFLLTDADKALFTGLIDAAKTYRAARKG